MEARLPVISFAVVMNKKKWEALPDDVKKVFDDLYFEQADWTGEYVDKHVEDALAWSKENHGVTVTRVDDAQLAEIKAKLAPMMDAYVKRVAQNGIDGQKLIDFLQKDEGNNK